jgi:hypothetical protein
MEKSTEALERLHEEIRLEKLKEEKETEEWIRMQTTGGGAET